MVLGEQSKSSAVVGRNLYAVCVASFSKTCCGTKVSVVATIVTAPSDSRLSFLSGAQKFLNNQADFQ